MILEKFSLEGRCGIVTGAGSGIGKGIARGLAEAGARVALAGQNLEKVDAASREMNGDGLKTVPFRVDVSEERIIADLVRSVVQEFGRIDFLFNNAGTIYRSPFPDFPLEEWERVIKVNLTGPFILSQAVARHMIEKGIKGSIINTSSLIAVFGGVTVAAYAATKGGLTQLTRSMCNDLAKYGIRVNAIGPGWVKTDMTKAIREDPVRFKGISDRIPLGRWADPQDLAGLAVFLASDASSYITGQVIFIDGGYMVM
ncbi:MAG: SDR family oxidoreductase [Proteobacteria bacterium]|nr:SDR family oxidoreductase [Pseudomonadota bacterium]